MSGHFGVGHVLAPVVARLCAEHRARPVGGRVGCEPCWERAIRDDERAVVLFGLPRDLEPDPDLVDEVAVERVCAGDSEIELTEVERVEVVRRLTGQGVGARRVGERVGLPKHSVQRIRRREGIPVPGSAGFGKAA